MRISGTALWLLVAVAITVGSFSAAAASSSTIVDKYVRSHVIVEFESESLAHLFGPGLLEKQQRKRDVLNDEVAGIEHHATDRYSQLVASNVEARKHLDKMETERTNFLSHLGNALGLSKEERDTEGTRQYVARTYDHAGQQIEAIFTIALHGLALRVPEQYLDQPERFVQLVRNLPHVRSVSQERRVVPKLFSSGEAINLSAAYSAASIGNISMAGKGIKIASVDNGVYAAAPMFNGTGFSYPPGWTDAKKGDVTNCNGKVIVSKAFSTTPGFPSNPGIDDPNAHGTFSASIAGGVEVNATRGTFTRLIHGIAPQAWIMNYRISFSEIPIIQALEAALSDGADVAINSWAWPAYNYDDGPFSPIDRALVNLVRAGMFVAMAAGNEGPFLSTSIHASDAYITVGATSKASYLDTDSGTVVDAQAYMVANTSCRGPSVLRTLKPDITAPGVDILAQGYGPTPALASIEFGVQSGTSFATPVVAGAAALMKQIWPGWTPKQVKAAFMGSAKWKGVISNSTGIAAQPLEMGAGNLNLAGAINPGALLDPPSLSFSYLTKGQQKTIQVDVFSVANTTETYAITSVFTGLNSAANYSTPVTGISFAPTSITLAPGATTQINVTFDSLTVGVNSGDNQGFIVLTSAAYEVHMPLWARVLTPTSTSVLIVNAMGTSNSSSTILGLYTSALLALGFNSTVQEAVATPLTVEDLWWISSYPIVFVLSGNNGVIGSLQAIPEMTREVLREYTVMGGRVFLSGALAPVLARPVINSNSDTSLINFLIDSQLVGDTCPSGASVPTSTFRGLANGPKAFQQLSFQLLDTPSSRCVSALKTTTEVLFPREILDLVQGNGASAVAGKRAQPSKQYQGRRFDFATVTSTLSLEMIPEASRVPFVAAIIGYLTEEVNLSINVSSVVSGSGLGFRLSLASSLSDSLRSSFANPASLVPTYTLTFGDKTSKNIDGPVEAIAAVEYTHCYRSTGSYNVTVEAVSAFGTGAIWEQRVSATDACGSASSLRAPLACVIEWLPVLAFHLA